MQKLVERGDTSLPLVRRGDEVAARGFVGRDTRGGQSANESVRGPPPMCEPPSNATTAAAGCALSAWNAATWRAFLRRYEKRGTVLGRVVFKEFWALEAAEVAALSLLDFSLVLTARGAELEDCIRLFFALHRTPPHEQGADRAGERRASWRLQPVGGRRYHARFAVRRAHRDRKPGAIARRQEQSERPAALLPLHALRTRQDPLRHVALIVQEHAAPVKVAAVHRARSDRAAAASPQAEPTHGPQPVARVAG
jgi:hypothetical protein